MGGYATKAFFRKQMAKFKKIDADYFEVSPAPDCCALCESKANRKTAIDTATEDDYPPFHGKCRCAISPLGENEEAGALARQKARYASGEFPMKRCPYCNQWIPGNAFQCRHCKGSIA